jgi:hypothetical protein
VYVNFIIASHYCNEPGLIKQMSAGPADI